MKVSKVILSDEEIAIAERGRRGWDNAPEQAREAIDKDIAVARNKRMEAVQANQDAYDRSIGRKSGPPRQGKAKRVIE
tara:strand:+ start:100 stop:333 length:234 start_codon:yes stop_codon:yes gene_type:complete